MREKDTSGRDTGKDWETAAETQHARFMGVLGLNSAQTGIVPCRRHREQLAVWTTHRNSMWVLTHLQ